MGIAHGHNNLLDRISSGLSENAAKLHYLDLERLGRRLTAACRLQEMLADLKDRMVLKTAARTQSAWADRRFELPHKAA